jgi:hypothetical protein
MSQRRWVADQYEILTGYDRPLAYFFLVIDWHDDELQADEPVYSNLSDPDGPSLSLGQISAVLNRYGIEPPATLFADLRQDRLLQRGNFVHRYVPGAMERGDAR